MFTAVLGWCGGGVGISGKRSGSSLARRAIVAVVALGVAAVVLSMVPGSPAGTATVSAEEDFDTLDDAGNDKPADMWSDGTTMWVADLRRQDPKLYAYNLLTKARDSAEDFDTLDDAGNGRPTGIWSDGTTMWVSDWENDKLYAYNLLTKARDSAEDFDTLDDAGNNHPMGLWSDGTTMWVVDIYDNKIYAYDMTTKARDSAEDFDMLRSVGNNDPRGMWSDGTTMWVADGYYNRVVAYDMATEERVPSCDLRDTAVDTGWFPHGIWSDGTTMWVSDFVNNKINSYVKPTTACVSSLDSLAGGEPAGMWSDGTTMWVADGFHDKLFAYDLVTGARDSAEDFDTLAAAGNDSPTGMWSDGATMWVADLGDDKLYAYKMSDKARDPGKDFDTLDDAGNNLPVGLWSDGTTMWVSDWDDDKLYAYKVSDRSRDSAKDLDTLAAAGNGHPAGLWSDGTTVWVADDGDDKLYAYNLASGAHTSLCDLDDLASHGNGNPVAVWSDGATIWVSDYSLDRLYSYSKPSSPCVHTLDFLAGDDAAGIWGIWSDGTTMWVADSGDDKLYAYDLLTKARDSAEDFDTLGDARNGDPAGLWSDGTTMWVADDRDDKLYAYNLPTKARDWAKDIDALAGRGNSDPTGIWSDGATVWVADGEDGRVYAYDLPAAEVAEASAPASGVIGGVGLEAPVRLEWLLPDTGYFSDMDAGRADAGGNMSSVDWSGGGLAGDWSGGGLAGDWSGGAVLWTAANGQEAASANGGPDSADDEDAKPTDLRLEELHNAFVVRFEAPAAGDPDHYLIEWRSGDESYSPERSKTSTNTWRTVRGLENGTEYTVRVSAVDSEGDVGPGVEQTGTPMHFRDYIEENFIDPNVEAFPWLQEAWYDEPIYIDLKEDDYRTYGLYYSQQKIELSFTSYRSEGIVLHELAHHYTLTRTIHSDDAEARLGVLSGWLLLAADGERNAPQEAYAGALNVRMTAPNRYNSDSAMDQVMHHAGQGTIPPWFYDNYSTDGTLGGVDHDRLWAHMRRLRCLKGIGCQDLGAGVAEFARGLFGGLCSKHEARNVLWGGNAYHSPWVDGGCKNRRPQELTATLVATADDGAAVEVSWRAPLYATTPSIDRYVVQWKSGTQSYETSRQAIITDLSDLSHTITGLSSDVDYTVRVAAANSADTTDFTDADGRNRIAETTATDTLPKFDLATENSSPRGIWSDGTTMWVADSDDAKLYAYTLATGARNADKDVALASDNASPRGIWSDGTTMWVADSDDAKLYAYGLEEGFDPTA